jgi:hypothetical protein
MSSAGQMEMSDDEDVLQPVVQQPHCFQVDLENANDAQVRSVGWWWLVVWLVCF